MRGAGFRTWPPEGLLRSTSGTLARPGALRGGYAAAKRELQTVLQRKEKIEALERDASELITSYSSVMPGYVEAPEPQKCHRNYRISRLRPQRSATGA